MCSNPIGWWVWCASVLFASSGVTQEQSRVVLADLAIEGMQGAEADGVRSALLEAVAASGVVVPEVDQRTALGVGCAREPACLQEACTRFGGGGLLMLSVLRSGAVVRTTQHAVRCPEGLVVLETTRVVAVSDFPGNAELPGSFLAGLKALGVGVPALAESPHTAERPAEVALAPKVPAPPEKAISVPPVAPRAAPPVPGVLKRPERRTRTAGWITLAASGAVLASGAVTGLLALRQQGELAPLCSGGLCPPEQKTAVDRLDRLALATDVLLGIGAGGAVAAAVLLLLGGEESDSGDESAPLRPVAGPAWFGIAGRF